MDLNESERFLAFNYKELKDLGKHFLTISSASLVFILTFFDRNSLSESTKIISNTEYKFSGGLLAISVICAGVGLFLNYIAGSGAAKSMIWGIGKNYRLVTKFTYILYILAGGSLVATYLLLLFQFGIT